MTVKMPEPVATIWTNDADLITGVRTGVYTEQQMEEYAQAVRDEALEEAAQVCEEYEKKVNNSRADNRAQHFMGAMIGASACADAIRALKEQS